jgi:hypothetical protein
VGRYGQTGGGRTLAISCYRGCAMLPGGPEMEPYTGANHGYTWNTDVGAAPGLVYPTGRGDCCAGRATAYSVAPAQAGAT